MNTADIGGKTFHYTQDGAVKGHTLPGYLVKWGQNKFTVFDERDEMENWFRRGVAHCRAAELPFRPLEVIYKGQRCAFYADIECFTPPGMSTCELDALKTEIMQAVNAAYDARGLDSTALLWSENHRRKHPGIKLSFHVVGRDVDFEGTHGDSDLAHLAKKMNSDCSHIAASYPNVKFSTCGRTKRTTNLFDLHVYSHNRAMRCIYSSKENDWNSYFKPCAGFEGKALGDWWIVRDRGSTRAVHEEPWNQQLEIDLANVCRGPQTVQTYNDSDFQRSMNSNTENSPATITQMKLARRLQAYFQSTQRGSTVRVRYNGKYCTKGKTPADSYRLDGTNRYCDSCSRTHKRNGAGELVICRQTPVNIRWSVPNIGCPKRLPFSDYYVLSD